MRYAVDLKTKKRSTLSVTGFGGINVSESAPAGSLSKSLNLTCRGFPALSVRGRRAVIRSTLSADGIFGDDTLAWAESGKLYYGGREITGVYLTPGKKKFSKHGSMLLIFPDGIYYDTASGESGNMSVSYSCTEGAYACCVNGNFEEITYSYVKTEPDGAEPGDYCAVSGSDGKPVMKRYDGAAWLVCECFIKISASGIGAGFRAGDTVECTGLEGSIGSTFTIAYRTDGALFCRGVLPSSLSPGSVTVSRTVPKFDYSAVSGGRLWGVRRGEDKGGQFVCRVYASAPGSPFNFSPEGGGLVCDVDISGKFTGMCDFLGSPLAFSETEIIEIRIKNGSLITTVIKCGGIEEGAEESAVVYGGALYYKSKTGIFRYDGSYPECVSEELGENIYCPESGAPAVCRGGEYYIKLSDMNQKTSIYVYNIDKKVWHCQDDPGVAAFAKRNENIYALTENQSSENEKYGIVLFDYDRADGDEKSYCAALGYPKPETDVQWGFESGRIGFECFKGLYPIRLILRIKSGNQSVYGVSLIYDESFETDPEEISAESEGAVNIPIALKRCDTLRIKISGSGDCRILGYSLEYGNGGEVRGWK